MVKFALSRKGSVVKLCIFGEKLHVRKGTPDLDVAIESLGREIEPLRYLLDENYNGVILDCGGYIGTSAIKLSRMYPNAKVVTIESSNENYEILKKNVQTVNAIEAKRGAISAEAGEKTLHDRKTGEWGFTIVESDASICKSEYMYKVDAITVADVAEEYGSEIGMMKIDIEGG